MFCGSNVALAERLLGPASLRHKCSNGFINDEMETVQ